MRVLTYNIHKGIGGIDRRYELDRIIGVINHFNADIVLLQEVDQRAARSGFDHQPRVLADRLGFKYYSANVNHRLRRSGGYGNLTLSRWPISHSFNIDITLPFKKTRGALYTEVDSPSGMLHVFNVHLGLLHFERTSQLKRILGADPLSSVGGNPTVIAGDFNDWRGKLSRAVLNRHGFREAGHEHKGRHVRTFPAARPLLPLDRVYFRALNSARVIEDEAIHQRHASDHQPLAVEFVSPAPASKH
ncbi:MAG: endonuclease/exonuclease/phosphatase family protein [Planctomycetaceae bacterium]|nr:endonuclease/exonuclease/phosphatase family protein [Planctomycetaceae bacterium]